MASALQIAVRACIAALFVGLLAVSGRAAEESRVDLIIVEKSLRRTDLVAGHKVSRSYDIALGLMPVGHKQQEGDGKTPEGR